MFLELISSLLACMQQNVALLNAKISYARRLDLDEPVPGRTILSILSESGVNPNTCGRANSI